MSPFWFGRGDRARKDAELDEEIRSHLALAEAERVARGESPAEAAYAARREFGNVGMVKEITREQWGVLWIERLLQDLRYAVRSLRRAPGFATVAILTLALGIGMNTAMFTVMNGVLFRPLPFPRQDRLQLVSYKEPNSPWMPQPALSDRNYVEFRNRTRAFSAVGTFTTSPVTITGRGEAVRPRAAQLTPEVLGILGVAPALGAGFSANDGKQGSEPVALLSDRLWRDRFGADPLVVGKRVVVNGLSHTILGVMPPGFDFPERSALWRALEIRILPNQSRMSPVVGRLRDGVTPAQALAELQAMVPRFNAFYDQRKDAFVPEVLPLKTLVIGNVSRPLWIFGGAVGFVLLIACANVANLLLMRAASRQQEIAVRTALGAERPRLIRQLLTESLVIATIGGTLGVLLATVAVRALVALAPAGRIPRLEELGVDGAVLAFTALLCVATAFVFGLVPAFRATRRELRDTVAQGARTVTHGHGRLRGALVVGEIALALMLLAGAGLLLRSFAHMRAVELGFRTSNVVSMTVDLPENTYRTAPAMRQFHHAVVEGLAAIPGVDAVGAVNWRPLGGGLIVGDFQLDDGRKLPKGYYADKIVVSPGYFATMGIPLRAGRDFTDRDDDAATPVAIASASIARKFWPDTDPLGKRISMADVPGPNDWLTIVGVVDEVMQSDLKERHPALYQPIAQTSGAFSLGHMSYAVHTSLSPGVVAPAMRRAMRAVDPDMPVEKLAALDDLVATVTDEPLFQARLLTLFSVLALLLAAIGIYGVLAYSVVERTHEIGVRVALGARATDVSRLVMRRTLALSIPGLALGVAGALVVTRVLDRLLFGVKPNDPVTLGVVAGLLAMVAIVAALIPARRAARVDPLVALRSGS